MLRGIEAAKNGMVSILDLNDTIANNLANINTTGFKQSNIVFKDIQETAINKLEKNKGMIERSYQLGSLSNGSTSDALVIDFTQGGLKQTGNTFDVALNGDGFFKVKMPNGNIGYTRNGNFMLQTDGTLVTKENMSVLDADNLPIQIDLTDKQAKDIIITTDGTINLGKQTVGKMDLVDFNDKINIKALGNSTYVPTNPKKNIPIPTTNCTLVQGSLEASNGNIVTSMVNSINAQRSYESLNNVIQMNSKTLEKTISTVGAVKR
jgi:flagellar basal-body rod protein FlgG